MPDAADTVIDLPVLHTFEEIANRYGFSLRSMQDDARAGKFKHIRRGHAWRMTPDQLAEFLAMHTRDPQPSTDPLAGVRERRERRNRRATAPGQRKAAS